MRLWPRIACCVRKLIAGLSRLITLHVKLLPPVRVINQLSMLAMSVRLMYPLTPAYACLLVYFPNSPAITVFASNFVQSCPSGFYRVSFVSFSETGDESSQGHATLQGRLRDTQGHRAGGLRGGLRRQDEKHRQGIAFFYNMQCYGSASFRIRISILMPIQNWLPTGV
jgi:hypothetical protein